MKFHKITRSATISSFLVTFHDFNYAPSKNLFPGSRNYRNHRFYEKVWKLVKLYRIHLNFVKLPEFSKNTHLVKRIAFS